MIYYKCSECDYEYDPDENDGEDFEALPDDWKCAVCGADKDSFMAVEPYKDGSETEDEEEV
jgi:pyruvate oxidase